MSRSTFCPGSTFEKSTPEYSYFCRVFDWEYWFIRFPERSDSSAIANVLVAGFTAGLNCYFIIWPRSLWPAARFITLPSFVLIGDTIRFENFTELSLSKVVEFLRFMWFSWRLPRESASSSYVFVVALSCPMLKVLRKSLLVYFFPLFGSDEPSYRDSLVKICERCYEVFLGRINFDSSMASEENSISLVGVFLSL